MNNPEQPSAEVKPGLHDNLPSARYHADPCPTPSLSSGIAREIVEQSPAHAYLKHVRLGGRKPEPTDEMIFGGYVHALLGGGLEEFAVGDFDNYRTKAAQEWRDATEAAGKIPVLPKLVQRAGVIANAVREKAPRGTSNNPFEMGKPEVTAIWQEKEFWFRARYDRLVLDESGFADIWDWKTTGSVTPDAVMRTIIDKGYHIQAAHYIRGLQALVPRFAGRISFIFSFVETERPYSVRNVVLSPGFLQMGDTLLGRAIAEWKQCLASGKWPDGCDSTLTITAPEWYQRKVMEDAA